MIARPTVQAEGIIHLAKRSRFTRRIHTVEVPGHAVARAASRVTWGSMVLTQSGVSRTCRRSRSWRARTIDQRWDTPKRGCRQAELFRDRSLARRQRRRGRPPLRTGHLSLHYKDPSPRMS